MLANPQEFQFRFNILYFSLTGRNTNCQNILVSIKRMLLYDLINGSKMCYMAGN